MSRATNKNVKYTDLDEIDKKIVVLLRVDGRMSFRKIARELNVSEGMVRQRVKKLVSTSFIRICAIGDPLKLGVPVLATILLKVKPNAVDEVSNRLAQFGNVRYVAMGIGAHDIILESLHRDTTDLYDFILNIIGGMPSIISADTFQVVRIKKSIWDWDIPSREDELTYNHMPQGGDS